MQNSIRQYLVTDFAYKPSIILDDIDTVTKAYGFIPSPKLAPFNIPTITLFELNLVALKIVSRCLVQ